MADFILRFRNKNLNTAPLEGRLIQGEKNVDTWEIQGPKQYGDVDLSKMTWALRGVNSAYGSLHTDELSTPVDGGEIVSVRYTFSEEMLALAGPLILEVVCTDSGGAEVYKAQGQPVTVRESAAGKAVPPNDFEDKLNESQEAARQAKLSATEAKSWAVGGTGTRDGEDTDNAKYYAGQAKDAQGAAAGSAEAAEDSASNAADAAREAASSASAAADSASTAASEAGEAADSAAEAAESAKAAQEAKDSMAIEYDVQATRVGFKRADETEYTYTDDLTGPPGSGLPTGGTAGQVLIKRGEGTGNTEWKDPEWIPKAGGTFTGWLESGADNVGMMWEHPDGTKIRVRSYKPGNVFQITRERSGEAEQGILNIYKNSADFVGTASAAPWSGVTGKPSSFPPAAHNQGWDTITGKPSTFPPSSHTHDDRYYTESEMNTKLNSKANTSGTYTGLTVGTANTAKACSGNAATATRAANNFFGIGNGGVDVPGNRIAYYSSDPESGKRFLYGVIGGVWALAPEFASNTMLGTSGNRWKQLYATTGTIDVSDRNLKERIADLDERHLKLFSMLRPVSYALKNGEDAGVGHDRLHLGFIAQEVEAAMAACGITPEEFGGFCRDVKTETVQVMAKRVVTDPQDGDLLGTEDVLLDEYVPVMDKQGQPVYIYSLRYSEFIALNTAAIQSAVVRLDRQEDALAALEARLKKLEDDHA